LQIGSTEATISGNVTEVNPPPFIRNSRTVVPMGFIAECFGAEVQWDFTTKKITFLFQDLVIVMQIDNPTLMVNDKSILMDVPPFMFKNEAVVPLRSISEAIGAEVQWEAITQTITVILSEL
jgi:hypothetical protein